MAHLKTRFFLNISTNEFERVYRGTANSVVVKAINGQIIEFPAEELMPFLTPAGIHGWFEVVFSQQDQLLSFKKIIKRKKKAQ